MGAFSFEKDISGNPSLSYDNATDSICPYGWQLVEYDGDKSLYNLLITSYSWMKADAKKMKIEVTGLPKREEAEVGINEQLIVEYYSR